ncbi:MAG: hypothetical protein ACLS9K_11010 [Lachnospira eligens]
MTEAITSSGGNKVVFTVARDGKNVDVTVEPKMVEVESYDTRLCCIWRQGKDFSYWHS